MSGSPFRVFISYSHKDEEFRQILEEHLALLRRQELIAIWHDRKILPGQKWADEIHQELEAADLILLLVSSSFIASDYCHEVEMKRALARDAAGEAVVVPIVIRPCDWTSALFGRLQALPKDGRSVTKWRNRDDAWLDIAQGLRRAVEKLRTQPSGTKPGPTLPIFSVPFSRNLYFTGRDEVLAKLAAQLAAGGRAALSQIAAISGLGGIGKTQTAVEFAYRHRDDYPAGVFFLLAETEADLVSGFAKMAELLGLPAAADQNASAQAALSWLAANPGWLLILDNADTPALLEPYLAALGKGHVLITSREPNFASLHVDSEPLAPPPVAEALDFLLRRTRRENASPAEKRAASELAAELGNLPLALEQAAAFLVTRQVSFADYLGSYQERGLELLGKTGPEAGTRHDPVARTWKLNIEQIEKDSPASSDLLRAAAFLAPDAIPDELFLEGGSEISKRLGEAVAGGDELAVAELAAPLMRYSLIDRDAERRTLSIHRLVQKVLRQNLGEAEPATFQTVVVALRRAFPWPEFAAWPRCERLLPHLLAITNAAEEDTTDVAWLLQAGAGYLANRARFAEAEPLYKRSLVFFEKSLGDNRPNVASSLTNLAILYQNQGRFAEAEPLFERSLAIRESSLGEHPDVAQAINNLATLYWRQNRFAQAEQLYERALTIWEKSLSIHPEVARLLTNLASLYSMQGRFAEAEPLFKRALGISEELFGGDHPDLALTLNNLANVYRDQGRFAEAEPIHIRSLSMREKIFGADHPDVAQSLNNLANVYWDQGRLIDAKQLYERSLVIWERTLGDNHPDVATALENLASLQRGLGHEAEAEELEARARDVRARHAARNPRAKP